MVLLVDPNKFKNSYKKQVFEAYQKMLIARFLRYLDFEDLAKQNAYKALKIGLEYELQHIIINTSELLMTLSSLFGQSKLFNYYKQLHLNAIQTQQKESFINIDFLAIQTNFVNSSQFTPSIDQELSRAIKYAEKAYQQEGTYIILEHLTRLRSFYYELHHSYKALQSTWASSYTSWQVYAIFPIFFPGRVVHSSQ